VLYVCLLCNYLKDVSASLPLAAVADSGDVIYATSDPVARVKEAEVMISALNVAQPLTVPFVVPTVKICDTRSTVRHWAALYPLCQRDTSRQVCWPFSSRPYSDIIPPDT
jgi:hypothetical protein